MAFILAASAMVVPSFLLRTRFLVVFFCAVYMILFYFSQSIQKKKPAFLDWISRIDPLKNRIFPGAFLLLAGCMLFFIAPDEGIQVDYLSPNGQDERIFIHPDAFEALPTYLPFNFPSSDSGALRYSASFQVSEQIYSLLLYVSYGEAEWMLDGAPIAHFDKDNADRYLLISRSIPPGVHKLVCETGRCSPPPHIFARTGTQQPICGPFFQGKSASHFQNSSFYRQVQAFLLVLSFFFLLPLFNRFALTFSRCAQKFQTFSLFIFALTSIFLFVFIRFLFMENTGSVYEADEAAFGIMAERLIDGQSPPLFHYGQNYQGTLESFLLAFSLLFAGHLAAGLHFLPLVWGILFILLTVYTFWRYGGAFLAIFSLFVLSIGGLHFHWIISKTWFGYSFSLFIGSLLWLISFHALEKNRLSSGWAFLWGAAAGAGFYELPLSLPFILGSGCMLLKLLFGAYMKTAPSRHTIFSVRRLLISFYQSGFLLLLLAFFLTTSPYWISPFLSSGSDAMQFIVKGRSLAQPRVAGENPLVDRFFCECLPVLLGARAPYDHLTDIPQSLFPAFPPLLFFLCMVFYPFSSKGALSKDFLIRSNASRYSVFFFALLTVFFVSYSPFGIWPWYAIPLYWVFPLLLFVFVRFLWSFSPGASLAVFLLTALCFLSGFFHYNPMYHQPSSLSLQGMWIPPHFDSIKSLLHAKNIRYLLCDQGFDMSFNNAGRDWVGECLLFDSRGSLISVDRLSRRAPDDAQEIFNASRVGYLFHKDFYFNNPVPGSNPANYSPIDLIYLKTLFGPRYLNYEYYEKDPYVLFLPREKSVGFLKEKWSLSSSNPIFLNASVDHNLCLRGVGRDAYWSSDFISDKGCTFQITFDKPKIMQNLLLFHGTKTSDRTKTNKVVITTDKQFSYDAGSLEYVPEIRSSYMRLPEPLSVAKIEITVGATDDRSWWTLYEIWAY
ncbi:MAG: hypothetical protein JXR73_05305 [Candidatus Omnitrophica bacterium]|nr:hypothetical protein [Candidatus Omnitrophota bacterium]